MRSQEFDTRPARKFDVDHRRMALGILGGGSIYGADDLGGAHRLTRHLRRLVTAFMSCAVLVLTMAVSVTPAFAAPPTKVSGTLIVVHGERPLLSRRSTSLTPARRSMN